MATAGPLEQFDAWFKAAASCGVREPNAMSLATAEPGGVVSARYVLLKGYDQRGFQWYTNYDSRKVGWVGGQCEGLGGKRRGRRGGGGEEDGVLGAAGVHLRL
jgi:hypothetical protein